MFDGLDVKTTLNDIYDNGMTDDSWALIYRLYETNILSINTPVGQTVRRPVKREIITQGDCLGPILASSTVDTFGKECYQQQKHLYWYTDKTAISPLTMLDNVLTFSNCGPEATQMREFLNIKTGPKKLQMATEKTSKMHIGKTRDPLKCKDAFIDGWGIQYSEKFIGKVKVKEVFSTEYLREIICSDGSNNRNVSDRRNQGMLDTMCLGPYMF